MFTLGIYDIVQLFPHFMTGIFTITQTTFGYGFGKVGKEQLKLECFSRMGNFSGEDVLKIRFFYKCDAG